MVDAISCYALVDIGDFTATIRVVAEDDDEVVFSQYCLVVSDLDAVKASLADRGYTVGPMVCDFDDEQVGRIRYELEVLADQN